MNFKNLFLMKKKQKNAKLEFSQIFAQQLTFHLCILVREICTYTYMYMHISHICKYIRAGLLSDSSLMVEK